MLQQTGNIMHKFTKIYLYNLSQFVFFAYLQHNTLKFHLAVDKHLVLIFSYGQMPKV